MNANVTINQEVIKTAYDRYLLNGAENAQEEAVRGLAGKLDDMLGGELTELTADYEEASRCAGFYAGYMAALARLLGTEEG